MVPARSQVGVPRPSEARRSSASTFRPDIEGLRAVAVVLVVLFHASIVGFPGGFVGVDVFFVISGFLITGLLLRELQATGTVSLSGFYARRVRRLLPAALLVLLVTLALSVLYLPPVLVPGVAGDVAAAATYVSNMGFAVKATDYFAAGQAPSPVLHYWSLGVEEQFYLFWPAIMLLVARGARNRTRRVGASIAVVAIASFALSLWLTSQNDALAFYSLPTRAWELGMGGLLAVAGTRLRAVPAWAATVAGWAGIGLIVAAAVTFTAATPFPGTAALLPTLGAALVIVAGARPTTLGPAGLLSTAVPRFLGRISYSLYLWHWPLLVIPAEALGADLSLPQRLGLVAASVALAALTQRLVEDPFRHGRIVGTLPRRNLAMAGSLAVVVALISVGTGAAAGGLGHPVTTANAAADEQAVNRILNQLASEEPTLPPPTPGFSAAATLAPTAAPTPTPTPAPPRRPPTLDAAVPANLVPSVWTAHNDYPQSYFDHCHVQTDGNGQLGGCYYGNLNSKYTIALFGDSHALSWFPAVERIAEREGWRLLTLTMSTCSPADIPIYNPDYGRVSWECTNWRSGAVNELLRTHPDVILVTGTRGFETVDARGNVLSGDARTRAWEAGITRTLDRLVPHAGRVIYLDDTPLSRVDPPVCLSQHPNSELACATSVSGAINPQWIGYEQAMATQAGAGFIDPEYWVCPSTPCPAVLGNLLIYRDPGHLATAFSAALAGRLYSAIEQQLAEPPKGAASASPPAATAVP